MRPAGIGKRNVQLIALAILIMMSPITARAAGIRMDVLPSLNVEEGWDSNVFSRADNEVSSFGTRVVPNLSLRFTAPDGVNLGLSGSYERTWYHDAEAKGADHNAWNFRVVSSGPWRMTPNFFVTPSVYFVNTIDSDRRIQHLPTDDPLLPPISITNYGRTETQDFGGALHFEYLVSPKLTFGVNGRYSERRFTDDRVDGTPLTDDAQTGGGLSFSYLVSPLTKVGMVASGSHATFGNIDNTSTNTFSAGVSYSHQFSPVVHFNVVLGGSHIRQENTAGAPEQSKTTPTGSFRLTYLSKDFDANLYGNASFSGSSGFGEPTRLYTVGASLSDKFTQSLSWFISGAYQVSKAVFDENAIDLNILYGTARLQYQPWRLVSLYLSGNANRQESEGRFGSTIEEYSVNLGIKIANSYNIF